MKRDKLTPPRRWLPPRHPAGVAFVALLVAALVFVVWQWISSGGFPYLLDGNESALSFVHALNLQKFNPWETSFLTTYATDFTAEAVALSEVYTHNPNFPRYVHYFLLLLGLDSFTTQILLITGAMAVINLLAMRGALRATVSSDYRFAWLLLLPLAASLVDYRGYLAFTVNTYRVYTFALLWLALGSVASGARFWPTVLIFFALLQFEYGFALFVLAVVTTWLALRRPPGLWRAIAAIATGTGLSLGLYAFQLLTYFTPAQLWADFTATTQRRGGGDLDGYFSGTLPALAERIAVMNHPGQSAMLLWATLSALATLALPRLRPPAPSSTGATGPVTLAPVRRALAALMLSLLAGAVVTSVLLSNYFLEAYFGSMLPLLTFFNVVAATIVVADACALAARFATERPLARTSLGAVTGLIVLAPFVANSIQWWRVYPGLSGGYVAALQSTYDGQPIMTPGHFNQLVTALTHGPTLKLEDAESAVIGVDFSRFDAYRDASGGFTLLLPGLHWIGLDDFVSRLERAGYPLVARGPDHAFVRIPGPAYLGGAAALAASVAEYGDRTLHLIAPAEPTPGRQPLLLSGGTQGGSLVFWEEVGDGRIRLGVDTGHRGQLTTPPLTLDRSAEHELVVAMGSLYPPEEHPSLASLQVEQRRALREHVRLIWNGELVLEGRVRLLTVPPAWVRVGEAGDFPATATTFAGNLTPLGDPAWGLTNNAAQASGPFGAIQFELVFPVDSPALPEPLLTTGITGAGDFIFVQRVAPDQVQFGLDHWGSPLVRGPVVTIEPGSTYRLRCSLGSLYPPTADAWYGALDAAARARLLSHVTVTLDESTVLAHGGRSHRAPPPTVQVGENGIGGSTTTPTFSGQIRAITRLTPAELPPAFFNP